LGEELVEHASVVEPQVCQRASVDVMRLAADLVADVRARLQRPVGERRGLRSVAVDVAVYLGSVDADQANLAQRAQPDGVAVGDVGDGGGAGGARGGAGWPRGMRPAADDDDDGGDED